MALDYYDYEHANDYENESLIQSFISITSSIRDARKYLKNAVDDNKPEKIAEYSRILNKNLHARVNILSSLWKRVKPKVTIDTINKLLKLVYRADMDVKYAKNSLQYRSGGKGALAATNYDYAKEKLAIAKKELNAAKSRLKKNLKNKV